MKHLSKLVINPEKLMTDRELVMLRGGYDIDCGPNWVKYMCDTWACEECPPRTDPACIPDYVYYLNAGNWIVETLPEFYIHAECVLV